MAGGHISLVELKKRFGEVTAVDGISLEIEPGEFFSLLGPSGCGKTTTLRMIAGLEQASAGHILIGGRDVTGMSAAERDVSMVFQSYALFPHMTVLENVCYGLRAGGLAKARAVEQAASKLTLLGLSGFEKRLPSELSGGQQQRVAVARAIVLEPQVLLFDEPLSNLDAKLRRRVRDEIRALQQELGLTVVYVTHDQQEALAVSDRVIVMDAGRIAQDGTPRDLYERPPTRFVADFIGDANLLPVEVAFLDGDHAVVHLGSAVFRIPAQDFVRGKAELAVRPQAIRLGPRAGTGGLTGVVKKAAYLGTHMEYDVAGDGIARTLFVIDANVASPLEPGTEVGIEFAPDALRLLQAP